MFDPTPYYQLQEELAAKVLTDVPKLEGIQYVAGADVAYDEAKNQMVGALAVLNAETLEIVESAYHLMEITFPYEPGLFSFREIPSLIETYNKLHIKPQLIICDGHGVAHPKRMGMASHLGVELGLPTIGCAKKRLIGEYGEVGQHRTSYVALIDNGEEIGKVLRTQDGIKPVFVSVGHQINLQDACEWVLKMTPNYRLPETTRAADQLVNRLLKSY